MPFVAEARAFLFPALAHVVEADHILLEAKAEHGLPAGKTPSPVIEGLPTNVLVSCIKRAEDDDAVVVRLWENEGRSSVVEAQLAPCFARVVETNLNEQTLREVKRSHGKIRLEISPYKIVTLKLYREGR